MTEFNKKSAIIATELNCTKEIEPEAAEYLIKDAELRIRQIVEIG